MTIKINSDSIQFPGGTRIVATPTGIAITGNQTEGASGFLTAKAFSYKSPNIGENYGYTSGGAGPSAGANTLTAIQKFAFASTVSSTSAASLAYGTMNVRWGSSSPSNGYVVAGQNQQAGPAAPFANAAGNGLTTIQKFSFTADSNATNIGQLTTGGYGTSNGHSTIENGFGGGGIYYTTRTHRWSHVNDGNNQVHTNLTNGAMYCLSLSSAFAGYNAGGGSSPSVRNRTTIEKFPFSTQNTISTIGNLTQGRESGNGVNAQQNGYFWGGSNGVQTIVDKFNWSNENVVAVPNMYTPYTSPTGGTTTTGYKTASSSATTGFLAGGSNNGGGAITTVDAFSFASDGSSVLVGTLGTAATQASPSFY
jgi:hypothetical protein